MNTSENRRVPFVDDMPEDGGRIMMSGAARHLQCKAGLASATFTTSSQGVAGVWIPA
jgi:hypothetical protein